MSTPTLRDAISREVDTNEEYSQVSEQKRSYQVLTETELIQLIVYRSAQNRSRTMPVIGEYSSTAFVLQTAAHNQLIYEEIPPGSFVMIDPHAEATQNSVMAYALPDQNTVALGIRDLAWEGYFISFGGRASHITSKRCVPLWPVVAVVGFDL